MQFGQNMQLLRSRCVGDARNTFTDPGGAGLVGRRSRPLTGGPSLSTDHHQPSNCRTRNRMPYRKGSGCDLHALPPMSALRHDLRVCRWGSCMQRKLLRRAGQRNRKGEKKERKGEGGQECLVTQDCLLQRSDYLGTWHLGARGRSQPPCLVSMHAGWRYLGLAVYGRGTSPGWVRVHASLTCDVVYYPKCQATCQLLGRQAAGRVEN